MKKLWRVIILALLMSQIFIIPCYAEVSVDALADMAGAQEVEDAIPDDAKQISGGLGKDGTYDAQSALSRLWERVVNTAADELQTNLKSAAALVAIALCSALAGSFTKNSTIRDYICIAGVCAAAGMLIGSVDGLVELTSKTLSRMSDYSRAALPAVFTAAAACGAVVSASARYAAVSIAIDVLMSMAQSVVITLTYTYLALSLSNNLFDNAVLKTCQRFSKWLATTFMTVFTILFSGYIGLTGIVTSGVDAVAARTARTVISTALPVVGGIISDAAATVLSAAGMIKNSTGALSLVAVAALCAQPFVVLSVKLLLFRAAATMCDMVPNEKLAAFINDVGTALSLLLGLVGCCAIMLFISFTSVIKVVTA